MNIHLLTKTVGIAIAATGILVSIPSFAGNSPCTSSELTIAGKPTAPAKNTTTAGTIVDVATSNGSFKTLVAAIKAAGLVDTLSGKSPFTVFAPTDAAFAALPKGTLEKLLKPENKATLVKILTYHVVSGSIDAKSIKPGAVKTVEGSPVKIQVKGSVVTVDKAKVTKADVKASNGVIHVIDKVILPPGLKL